MHCFYFEIENYHIKTERHVDNVVLVSDVQLGDGWDQLRGGASAVSPPRKQDDPLQVGQIVNISLDIMIKEKNKCYGIFEEMKNLLIHNCIGSHTNCFMSLLGQSSVTTNFEKSLHKIKSQIVLE